MRERPAKVSLTVQDLIDILLEIWTNLGWLYFHFRIFNRKKFIKNVGHFDVPACEVSFVLC